MDLPVTNHPEPRRHHYVPQCWLKGFTETRKNDGRLWVTDLSRRKQWPSTPENAGYKRDFYRLPDPSPDPVAVEKFFSVLEGEVAPILQSIDTKHRAPDDDELDLLLTFMAYQFVRLPSFRPIVLEVADRISREALAKHLQSPATWTVTLKKAGMDPDAPGAEYERAKLFFESGEWNITAETDWYMHRAFAGVDGILARLRERLWHTSVTERGGLIASDNPVVLEGDKDQKIGFRNAEFVFYPISRHVFITGVHTELRKPVHNYKYFARMNTMMLLRAETQVYSHGAGFTWCDANGNTQDDWNAFSKDQF